MFLRGTTANRNEVGQSNGRDPRSPLIREPFATSAAIVGTNFVLLIKVCGGAHQHRCVTHQQLNWGFFRALYAF